MTITHEHFLARIQSSEGESLRTAQAIYADWLEEQGDPRAGLLRLGIRIQTDLVRGDWYNCSKSRTLLRSHLRLEGDLWQHIPDGWLCQVRMPNVLYKDLAADRFFWIPRVAPQVTRCE